ncbi:MAG: lipid A biosynthesis acyltransferase [Zoogloeaceae bacterium]|jgi:KDO2-lipid IV(A) lauroyltransferase|nr:lipid A biosynthesis acyltransferase [Zoogloeaceae bacterium]
MSRLFTYLTLGFLWLLHWLPLPVLAAIGRGLGRLFFWLATPRRRVVRINLRLCFPDLTEAERERLVRAHFAAVTRSLLERGILWFASEARIRRLVRFKNQERFDALAGQPVILLVPHFVGLDWGGARIAMHYNVVSMYARQKNPVLDKWLLHGRTRFGDQQLLSRQDGVRGIVKALKTHRPFYYLPDMDYGPRDSIFVPFFGVPAATISGLPRLAALGRATVLPVITRALPDGAGYEVEFGEPWTDYPSGDLEADTRRMNAEIERWVLTMPEQYYWVHKRFKTRPKGEKSIYAR